MEVRAEIVAAVLNLEETAGAVAKRINRLKNPAFVGNRNHWSWLLLQVAYYVGQVHLVVGTENIVHAFDGGHFARLELCVAANGHKNGFGVAVQNLVDGLAAFFVGKFGDGAGVDNCDIGIILAVNTLIACVFELLGNPRCFGEIQLASQRYVSNLFRHF